MLNQAAARRVFQASVCFKFIGERGHPWSSMKTDYPSIQKFRELVELKDFKPPTRKEYVRYVRRLADHFQRDPATLSEDQVRQYFLFLRQHKNFSGSAMSIGKAAFRLFFGEHLGQAHWKVFSDLVIRRHAPLPLVLSRQE